MFDFSLYEPRDIVFPFEFLILKRARGYKFAAETTTTLNTEIRVAQFKSNRDNFSIHGWNVQRGLPARDRVASKDDNNINARWTRPSSLEKKNPWQGTFVRSSRTIPERTRAERVCLTSFCPIQPLRGATSFPHRFPLGNFAFMGFMRFFFKITIRYEIGMNKFVNELENLS